MQWAGLILALSGVVLAIAGLGLLLLAALQPGAADIWPGQLMNFGMRDWLERPRHVERFIYRHHRVFGSAIVVGALLLLGFLVTYHDRLVERIPWRALLGAKLALTAVWVLLLFALTIGAYILFRPSALKRFESLANAWIEPLAASASEGGGSEKKLALLMCHKPLRTGILFLLAGLSCLVAAAKVLVH